MPWYALEVPGDMRDHPLSMAQPRGSGKVKVGRILTHDLEHGGDRDELYYLQFWLCLPRAKGNYRTLAV